VICWASSVAWKRKDLKISMDLWEGSLERKNFSLVANQREGMGVHYRNSQGSTISWGETRYYGKNEANGG